MRSSDGTGPPKVKQRGKKGRRRVRKQAARSAAGRYPSGRQANHTRKPQSAVRSLHAITSGLVESTGPHRLLLAGSALGFRNNLFVVGEAVLERLAGLCVFVLRMHAEIRLLAVAGKLSKQRLA